MVQHRTAIVAAAVVSIQNQAIALERDMEAIAGLLKGTPDEINIKFKPITEALERANSERAAAASNLESMTILISRLRHQNETLETSKNTEMEEIHTEETKRLDSMVETLTTQLTEHENRNEKLQLEVSKISNVNARLKEELDVLNEKHVSLIQQLNVEMGAKATIQLSYNATQEGLVTTKAEIRAAIEKAQNLTAKHTEEQINWNDTKIKLQEELKQLREDFKVIKDKHELRHKEEHHLNASLQSTLEKLKSTKQKQHTLMNSFLRVQTEYNEAQAKLEKSKTDLACSEEECAKLKKKISLHSQEQEQEMHADKEAMKKCQEKLEKCQQEKEELIRRKEDSASELIVHQEKSSALRKQLANFEAQLTTCKRQLHDKHCETTLLNTEIANLTNDLARELKLYRTKEDTWNTAIEVTTQQTKQEHDVRLSIIENAEKDLVAFKAQKTKILTEMQHANDDTANQKNELAQYTTDYENTTCQCQEADATIADLEAQIDDLKQVISSTIEERTIYMNDLMAKVNGLSSMSENLSKAFTNETNLGNNLESELNELIVQHTELKKQYRESEEKRVNTVHAIDTLKTELAEMEKAIEELDVNTEELTKLSTARSIHAKNETKRLKEQIAIKSGRLKIFNDLNGGLTTTSCSQNAENNTLSTRVQKATKARSDLIDEITKTRSNFDSQADSRRCLESQFSADDQKSLNNITAFRTAEWQQRIKLLQLHGQFEAELKALNFFMDDLCKPTHFSLGAITPKHNNSSSG